MKRKTFQPLLGRLVQEIAPKVGATVIVEPQWKIVGQIAYKSGCKRYFRYSSLDLNSFAAAEIATDKDYANFFMEQMGYPIVPGSKTFFSDEWAQTIGSLNRNIEAAYRHARKLGFPVIVKPNSGSQGAGVALAHNRREFFRAMRAIFKQDRVAIVQRRVTGKDYRLVVLDDEVISAYQRIPLNVVGDGRSTVVQLLRQKQRRFFSSGRDTRINFGDPRITERLKRQGMSLRSVPSAGLCVYLLENANLSTGGEALDVTGIVHPAFRDVSVKLSRDMGLRLCGVDLMVAGDITDKPGEYWILEINSSPGLDHYAQTGRVQRKIVEDLYLRVLKSMEK